MSGFKALVFFVCIFLYLIDTFSQLGAFLQIEVEIIDGKSENDLLDYIWKFNKRHEQAEMLMLIILCHGKKTEIMGLIPEFGSRDSNQIKVRYGHIVYLQ